MGEIGFRSSGIVRGEPIQGWGKGLVEDRAFEKESALHEQAGD